MAEWLGQASQGDEVNCHDLEVMGSNPCQVEQKVSITSVYVVLEQKISIASASV